MAARAEYEGDWIDAATLRGCEDDCIKKAVEMQAELGLKGVTDGERLRLPAKGGKGANGGRDGDLYLVIHIQPHRFFRVTGRDLYLDLPLAPWEAVLGTSVEIPTLGGPVRLKVRPGTQGGQQLRLAKRCC